MNRFPRLELANPLTDSHSKMPIMCQVHRPTFAWLLACCLLIGAAPQDSRSAETEIPPDLPIPTLLAKRGMLILDDDGSRDRGGKLLTSLTDSSTLRAAAGKWQRSQTNPHVWRSTWNPGMGHTPVAAYRGFSATNLIIEVTFRYGTITEPWHTQCFRIATDQRPQITGHILSAWANPNNDFIETGFLLQHIRKTPQKQILEDLLLDRQPLTIQPQRWYTAVLEIVGNEALFRMGRHVAYARAEQLRRPKNVVSLTMGTTWHEIRRVRIWQAEAHPSWAQKREAVLQSRTPFTAKQHRYRKP